MVRWEIQDSIKNKSILIMTAGLMKHSSVCIQQQLMLAGKLATVLTCYFNDAQK